MRALIGGFIGAIVFASAAWALAGITTPANAGGPYQIYILDDADQPEVHVYALSVGDRATAARVENCDGSLLDNPREVVADLRRRSRNEDRDLNVIWVEGEGSRTDLGPCPGGDDEDEDEDPESERHRPRDSIIVLRDANAAQARRLINQIHGLSREERVAMIEALGLDRRTAARR